MPAATEWTEELVDTICDLIAGGLGIAEIAGKNGIPHETTIYRHMANDDEFASRIARARAAQQDREVDEMVRLADEADEDNWQVVKLRIWARQWRAAKLAPKKYGDRIDVTSGGEKIESPDMDLAKAAKLAAILAEAQKRKEAADDQEG